MKTHKWWQTAVFYQIYPRSFADGNGDGIGDLQGLTAKLDYLRDLGVDALWLSPHYPSPLYDCGYDVADYVGVAPEYGTLDDFRHFLTAAHQRGLHVILDFVLNHTSHQHAWFLESRSSRDPSAKRDWYIWREGVADGPPNDWQSTFGGSAWELDPATGQYYYHFFLKEQPDLNWRNPAVQAAMFDAARFWLDLGVDGFRLDALGTLFEDPSLPPRLSPLTQLDLYRAERGATTAAERAQFSKNWRAVFHHQHDLPEVHDVMRALRRVVDEYDDRVLVGETDDITYYGNGGDELHMVFNFPLMGTPRLTPGWIRANQAQRLAALPAQAWPCNTLGNHDSPRVLSRYADGKHNEALARLSLALMLTLRGTPFLYNGEEIGMADYLLSDAEQFRDLWGLWVYRTLANALGVAPAEAVREAAQRGRDKCRTPMQWANAAQAGFCPPTVQPWLPVHPNFAQGVTVADQEAQSESLLNFYRRLLRVRRATPALLTGDYKPLLPKARACFVFARRTAEQRCLVALNFSTRPQKLNLTGLGKRVRCLYSNRPRPSAFDDPRVLSLAPFEIHLSDY